MNKILLIGCGNLGSLLLDSWKKRKFKITIIEKDNRIIKKIKNKYKQQSIFSNINKIKIKEFNFIVLCVKPVDFKDTIRSINNFIEPEQVIISLVAGLKRNTIRDNLSSKNTICRIMPNIFSSVESSSTAIYVDNKDKALRNHISGLFKYFGNYVFLEKESELDFFTAFFGGGPAYIFLFMKILKKIMNDHKLFSSGDNDLLFSLFEGSIIYLKKNKDIELNIKRVASKGGTTEEALKYLIKGDKLLNLMQDAIRKATLKSKLISKSL